jgi:hypothetical protein
VGGQGPGGRGGVGVGVGVGWGGGGVGWGGRKVGGEWSGAGGTLCCLGKDGSSGCVLVGGLERVGTWRLALHDYVQGYSGHDVRDGLHS